MKKSLVALLLAVAMLLSVVPAMAESVLPWTGDEIVYNGFSADMGFTEDPETLVMQAYMADLGNASINWTLVPSSDLATKLNVFYNSGDIPDIAWSNSPRQRISDYGSMDYWLDLNQYLDYMPNLASYKEDYGFLTSMEDENGALFCIMDIEPYDYIDEAWFYNKTALEALGYTEPPKTWDEMHQMMLEYKAANPDGQAFMTYAWGWGTWAYDLAQLGGWSVDEWSWDENAQSWTNNIINGEIKPVIELMNTLYTEGLIHPEYSSAAQDTLDQYTMSGNWLFSYYYKNSIEREKFKDAGMPYEIDSFLTPAWEEGAQRYASITVRYDAVPGWCYFAAADVEHPEVMASIMDYFISPRGSELFNWGIEGVSFDYDENGNKYYLEDYATNSDKQSEIGMNAIQGVRCIMLKDRYSEFVKATDSGKKALAQLSAGLLDGTVSADYMSTHATPAFTAEESETKSYSTTPMSTYWEEQRELFVNGERSMDEWDAFVEEYKALGNVEEVLEIYNNAEQVVYSTERKIPTNFIVAE